MVRAWFAWIVVAASVAQAQAVAVPPTGSPVVPRKATEPARPRGTAPGAEIARLDQELKSLQGLPRAERLLDFAAAYPLDPRASSALAEAKAAMARAPTGKASDALVRTVDAVLSAPDAERRSLVGSLAATRDRRAIPVLVYLAKSDPDAATRSEAARDLGRFGPVAEQAALGLARHAPTTRWGWSRSEDREVQAAAIRALGDIGTAAAERALETLALDSNEPDSIRQVALDTLGAHFPAAAVRLHLGPRIVSSSGRPLATVVGALSGSYLLGLVGALSPSAESWAGREVGAAGGLVIGGTAAYLLSRAYPLSAGDAGYLLSAGVWSVPVGTDLGGLTGGPAAGCGVACNGVMLATHVVWMGAAWLTRRQLHLSLEDDLDVNLAAASALLITAGALKQPTPGTELRPAAAILAGGTAAGFIAGAAFAHDLELTPPLLGFELLGTAEGVLAGTLVGDAWIPANSPTDLARHNDRVLGLGLLGAGVGVGAILAASAAWRPTLHDFYASTLTTLDGNLLGGGLAAFASRSSTVAEGWTGIGGLVGLAAGIGFSRSWDAHLDGGDVGLVLLGQAFAAWQGIGWAAEQHLFGQNDRAATGLSLTLPGLAGAGLLALAGRYHWPFSQGGWAFSGAVWGGWLAGWTSYALAGTDDENLSAWLIGSDVGLVAGVVAVSPLFEVRPATLAWTSIGGVAGMTLATMGTIFIADPNTKAHPVATANVVGTVVGLVAGGVVSHWLEGPGSGGDAARVLRPDWLSGFPLPAAGIAPMMSPDGRAVEGLSGVLAWSL